MTGAKPTYIALHNKSSIICALQHLAPTTGSSWLFGSFPGMHPVGWTGGGPENRLTEPGFRGESPWLSTARIRSSSSVRSSRSSWVAKYEAGGLDSDAAAADALADYEARIAALERLVGKLALENEFLKGASRHVHQLRSASTSVVAGPVVSQSQKDAG
jgi:hypothetical protein